MGFFDEKENVLKYIDMAKDYDGKEHCAILQKVLKKGASLLELGMGPGKDLIILNQNYDVTGSEMSQIFLDMFNQEHPEYKLLQLDAISIETDENFDSIYSNKVLQHLTIDELKKSIKRQYEILNKNGIIFHSFWFGEGEEYYDGMLFRYYSEEELKKEFSKKFRIIEMRKYKEFEDDDSIYVLAQKL